MSIKGYKVFNPDWTCRDFKYEVGEIYTHDGNIEVCKAGFHFCQKASDCFNYYRFDSNNKVAEVEAIGLVQTFNDKSVTDKIFIKKEIKWNELIDIVNEGRGCTGLCNTGDCNTGNRNTGSWNTGSWNKSNWSCGFFNTVSQQLIVFNKPLNMDINDFLNNKGLQVLNSHYEDKWWIYSENMTDEEKAAHPEHLTTGGYLKTVDFKTACQRMWGRLNDEEKEAIKEIPNFDAAVFKEITGIEV